MEDESSLCSTFIFFRCLGGVLCMGPERGENRFVVFQHNFFHFCYDTPCLSSNFCVEVQFSAISVSDSFTVLLFLHKLKNKIEKQITTIAMIIFFLEVIFDRAILSSSFELTSSNYHDLKRFFVNTKYCSQTKTCSSARITPEFDRSCDSLFFF